MVALLIIGYMIVNNLTPMVYDIANRSDKPILNIVEEREEGVFLNWDFNIPAENIIHEENFENMDLDIPNGVKKGVDWWGNGYQVDLYGKPRENNDIVRNSFKIIENRVMNSGKAAVFKNTVPRNGWLYGFNEMYGIPNAGTDTSGADISGWRKIDTDKKMIIRLKGIGNGNVSIGISGEWSGATASSEYTWNENLTEGEFKHRLVNKIPIKINNPSGKTKSNFHLTTASDTNYSFNFMLSTGNIEQVNGEWLYRPYGWHGDWVVSGKPGQYIVPAGQKNIMPPRKGERLNTPTSCSSGGEWIEVNTTEPKGYSVDWNTNATPADIATGQYFKVRVRGKSSSEVAIDDVTFAYAPNSRVYRDGALLKDKINGVEFTDTTVTDSMKPSRPIAKAAYEEDGVFIDWNDVSDIGNEYKYSIGIVGKNGLESIRSDEVSQTVISGIKDYEVYMDGELYATTKDSQIKISNKDIDLSKIEIYAVDNKGNKSEKALLEYMNLVANSNVDENSIELDWNDVDETLYTIFKKNNNDKEFQSISATNLGDGKKVKVLSIYPGVEGAETETFINWRGEEHTISAAGRIKRWAEEPVEGYPKGYGLGIIDVDLVMEDDFSSNPMIYMKEDGKYKYDVIFLGAYDEYGKDTIESGTVDELEKFVKSGRGLLLGHDTCSAYGYEWCRESNKLAKYVDIALDGRGEWDIGSKKLEVVKNGLLTSYPYVIGEIGESLDVPLSHTLGQIAYGDVWMKYVGDEWGVQSEEMNVDGGVNNFYLTSKNNTAFIQTGHSNGLATIDEQKLLMNTLFYLKQLSEQSYLLDRSGRDIIGPNKPIVNVSINTDNTAEISMKSGIDNGSTYTYYVEAEKKDGSGMIKSNQVTETITTGLKGYSYVFDNKPNTIPDDIVESVTGDIILKKDGSKRYLHVKAIDGAKNGSDVIHREINFEKPKTPLIQVDKDGWRKEDGSFTIGQISRSYEVASFKTSITSQRLDNILERRGHNVVYREIGDNIDSSDIIMFDAGWFDIPKEDAANLNGLYEKGKKIFTMANDDVSETVIVNRVRGVPSGVELGYKRNLINEASYVMNSKQGITDSMSSEIVEINQNAEVWYSRITDSRIPSVIYIKNDAGGEWIHVQDYFRNDPGEIEFIEGCFNYMMDSVSENHLTNIQYRLDDEGWMNYTGQAIDITKEGVTTIEAKNIDTMGIESSVAKKDIRIDRTPPGGSMDIPKTTSELKVKVSLTGLNDTYSGLKSVRVSTKPDFSDGTGYINNVMEKMDINIVLPGVDDNGNVYSRRNIYVELMDNVGNKKILQNSIEYDARPPQKPRLLLPENNIFYKPNDKIMVKWVYADGNIENPKKQTRAIIYAQSEDGQEYKINVDGPETDASMYLPKPGLYKIKVEVFNELEKSNVSDEIIIKYGVYSGDGHVTTIDIEPGTVLRYLKIVSKTEMPVGTEIKGRIYYRPDKSVSFKGDKFIEFDENSDVIKLPEKSGSIKVVYLMKNSNDAKVNTPLIDNVIVKGK